MERPILNIISSAPLSGKTTGGPNKVFFNTIKGLDLLGYPYVVNQKLSLYKYNWIHDSQSALIEAIVNKIPAIVGPNIATLPQDLPILLNDFQKIILIHPSHWPIDSWRLLGYKKSKLVAWPSGVDTEMFSRMDRDLNGTNVMVYFKNRDRQIIDVTYNVLLKYGLKPVLIEYGNYKESEYLETLRSSIFGVWIGISESQGIGLQEALATNLPLIVMDCSSLFENQNPNAYRFPKKLRDFKVTTVPYFDDRCGLVIKSVEQLDFAIQKILNDYQSFNPASYIENELNLAKQAHELIEIFKLFDESNGQDKSRTSSSRISNAYLQIIIWVLNHINVARKILRSIMRRTVRSFR